jgi:hypothetical protein
MPPLVGDRAGDATNVIRIVNVVSRGTQHHVEIAVQTTPRDLLPRVARVGADTITTGSGRLRQTTSLGYRGTDDRPALQRFLSRDADWAAAEIDGDFP